MNGTTARYDGLADWYDGYAAPGARASAAVLVDLLGLLAGRSPGALGGRLCLDLGCGTGLNAAAIRATGRIVAGLDASADQLRYARHRSAAVLRADAAALPFADATFGTVTALWMSTDVDDFAAVLAEAARVLVPGGLLVFCGVHPCFSGPHSQQLPDGGIIAHPGYRDARWHHEAPWRGENIRRTAGMCHRTLAGLLSAFPAAGLVIERVTEPGDRPVPVNLGVCARRPQAHYDPQSGCHPG
jgi:SAM-dependent methyltransferase